MGCDIHLFVEKRVDGKWVSVDKWQPADGEERAHVDYNERFYSGRNYDLFAILADVRNGVGFAAIDTGDGFQPIDDPRGLPVDVSPEVAADSEGWGVDGHSHSYFSVAELMAYDWTQVTRKRGCVNGKNYAEWARYARARGDGPRNYCGDVWGQSVKKVSPDRMACLIAVARTLNPQEQEFAALSDTYCNVEWTTPYYVEVSHFLGSTLPRLWRLGAFDDVRIVFWFDN